MIYHRACLLLSSCCTSKVCMIRLKNPILLSIMKEALLIILWYVKSYINSDLTKISGPCLEPKYCKVVLTSSHIYSIYCVRSSKSSIMSYIKGGRKLRHNFAKNCNKFCSFLAVFMWFWYIYLKLNMVRFIHNTSTQDHAVHVDHIHIHTLVQLYDSPPRFWL